jgi:GT2 family glycosyltransferase
MYCPDSIVYHVGAGTLNKDNPHKTYLNFRNNLAMLKKNLPAGRSLYIIFIRFWLDFFTLLTFLLKGKFANAFAINKAHFHFLLHIRRNSKKSEKDISKFNKTGLLRGSIVWQYFINRKNSFSKIDF